MNSSVSFQSIVDEFAMTDPESNLYFLLDHSGLPKLSEQLLKTSTPWKSLFDCSEDDALLSVSPILICVCNEGVMQASKHFLRWVERKSVHTSSVIMLASFLDFNVMRNRLFCRLNLMLSEDMPALLRFFDSRILENMKNILSVEQQMQFFSVAYKWKFINRQGSLEGFSSIFSDKEIFNAPLVLDQCQEFALLEASEIDQVLDLLQADAKDLVDKIPVSERYRFVDRCVQYAKCKGITSVLKLAFYSLVVMLKGEAVMDDQKWELFMERLKRHEGNLSDLYEDFFMV